MGLLILGACGGGDSGQPDGSMMDATLDVAPDTYEASVDVAVDVPPVPAIWVATAWTLYRYDPLKHVMSRATDFQCSGEPMIDLAMNANEELFGITSESVVRIDKTTGVCTAIARGALDLPYATSFIPAASLEGGIETWRGYKYSTYSAIDPDSGALTFVGTLGPMGNNLQASGDIVTVPNGKTFLTGMTLNPMTGDVLVEVDPNTGEVTNIDTATGAPGLLGMAQWAGVLYMFSVDGTVYRGLVKEAGVIIQPYTVTYDWGDSGAPDASVSDGDAEASTVFLQPSWRGAAVTTRAPGL